MENKVFSKADSVAFVSYHALASCQISEKNWAGSDIYKDY